MSTIKIERIISDVPMPVRGSEFSAGLDLFNPNEVELFPEVPTRIQTGLKIIVPPGTYGRIAPRSGLSLSHNLWINAGVIDQDYRGEVELIVVNFNKFPCTIPKHMKIAQLICEKIELPCIEETGVENDTERGSNGFGSTSA